MSAELESVMTDLSGTGSGSNAEAEAEAGGYRSTSTSYVGDDTTSDEDLSTRPKKKARYTCSFRPASNTFKWTRVSKKGTSFAFCTVCSRDVSVAYGGIKDLKKHELTNVHQAASRSTGATNSLTTNFHNKAGPKRDDAVVEAEVKFSYFLAEHHLALSLADHCSKLFPSLFPDSCIAKAFKCGRTKATAIVKVIAQEAMQDILSRLKEFQYFSIHSDETTDITVHQQCGIMLRYFDNTEGKVRCIFFKLETVQKADAEGLFQVLDRNFTDEGCLCYANLVGMGSDGANVMLGQRNCADKVER